MTCEVSDVGGTFDFTPVLPKPLLAHFVGDIFVDTCIVGVKYCSKISCATRSDLLTSNDLVPKLCRIILMVPL